jgi:hypothetical protein
MIIELSPCCFAGLYKMTFFLIKKLGLITKESRFSFFIGI